MRYSERSGALEIDAHGFAGAREHERAAAKDAAKQYLQPAKAADVDESGDDRCGEEITNKIPKLECKSDDS